MSLVNSFAVGLGRSMLSVEVRVGASRLWRGLSCADIEFRAADLAASALASLSWRRSLVRAVDAVLEGATGVRVVRNRMALHASVSTKRRTYRDFVWRVKRGLPVFPPSAALHLRSLRSLRHLLRSQRGCCPAGPQLRPRPGKETSPSELPLRGDRLRCVVGRRYGLAIKVVQVHSRYAR